MKNIRVIAILIPFVMESFFIRMVHTFSENCLDVKKFISYYDYKLSDCHRIIASDYNPNLYLGKDEVDIADKGRYSLIFDCNFMDKGKSISVKMKRISISRDHPEYYDLKNWVYNETIAMGILNVIANPFFPLFLGCVYNNDNPNTDKEFVYIITEALDDNLNNIIKGNTKKPELTDMIFTPQFDRVIKVLYQVALAIQSLHNIGIGHFDIKPDNIMIDEKFEIAKLIDFGYSTSIVSHKNEAFVKNHKNIHHFIFI